MKKELSDWLKFIHDKKIEFVDIKYVDLAGGLHHITYPVDRFPVSVEKGVGFDSSTLPGFKGVEAGDMVLKPELRSGFLDPVFERPTLSFFAEIHDPKTGGRFSRDPRAIALRAQESLIKGLKLKEALFLSEFEFYLFDSGERGSSERGSSERGSNGCGDEFLDNAFKMGLPEQNGPSRYHTAPPADRASNFRSDLLTVIQGCGIKVKYHHHEVGPAQQEIELELAPLLKTADSIVLVKYLVKNWAWRIGKSATFIPMPVAGIPGSGLHIHEYFLKNQRSFFGDTGSKDQLSRDGRYYIGGLIDHARALCALTNPSTNSYKRLGQGLEAPNFAFYARSNRTAAIRIPGYLNDARDLRIEYRPPDATANPYLALAGLVLAGLDGVKKRIEPPAPVETDVRKLSPKEQKRLLKLPASLDEALRALADDNDFLKVGGIFDDEFIKVWIELKRDEAARVNRTPHPVEYQLYYDC
jgi:glutamine synthetase